MSTVDFKYELGDTLRETVTGFKGVVMVRAEYSTGCIHYGLQSSKLKDGVMQDWYWLDASRLELVKSRKVKFNVDKNKPSGAFPSGPQA